MTLPVFRQWQVSLVAVLVAVTMTVVGSFFYVRSRDVMQEELRERLRSVAAAAALHIDGDTLDAFDSPEDLEDPSFRSLVTQLDQVRNLSDIRFVYILRQTGDPDTLAFVADADIALSDAELDVNGNGQVDPDEEPGYPGEFYDISEIPALQGEAFMRPTVDRDVTVDQWGTLVSGYAPIRGFTSGDVKAVLGVDMRADDFYVVSQRIFSPVALMLVLIAAFLTGGLIMLSAEHRQVRLLERINSERSGLLRLTFHQLGEPLTIMKWSLETLRDETDNPQLKKLVEEHVSCMDEGLGRLNSIIDTLQLAEKVDLNTLDYLPVMSSLREVIDNAVGEWSSSAHARGLAMKVSVSDDIRLPMDRTMIALALRQIIVNAVEYSEDNSTIRIAAKTSGRNVIVSVSDHGCGIPRKDMEHLFEKYRRASNAHLQKPDGNGLGLYITKGIIEKAGGTIRVESTEGKGTKVTFTLPVA